MENAALATAAIPQSTARVTISRVSSIVYSGAPAARAQAGLTLDAGKASDLGSGGSTIIDAKASAHLTMHADLRACPCSSNRNATDLGIPLGSIGV